MSGGKWIGRGLEFLSTDSNALPNFEGVAAAILGTPQRRFLNALMDERQDELFTLLGLNAFPIRSYELRDDFWRLRFFEYSFRFGHLRWSARCHWELHELYVTPYRMIDST